MRIGISDIVLPGAALGAGNPLPYLRDRNWHRAFIGGGLKEKEMVGFGYQTGRRVLPYTVYDGYDRQKRPMKLKTIVMENNFLKAVFLPEYGGRLYSLFDKTRQKELLFVNPVFQPCNIGPRCAWFSGGIEWNVGQYGHSTLTCEPVFFARCQNSRGEDFLRMYEYERIKGVFLQIDFHLPEDETCLYAHVNIFNSHDAPTSFYWWTNTAVELNRHMRVLSGNREIILTMPNNGTYDEFVHDTMPKPSGFDGLDLSYPENCPCSMEYFFQNERILEQTWEAAAYDDGSAFCERSTPEMPYRKMFCWSNRPGGRHWQSFLSEEGAPFYTEIQSGCYPTQAHGGDISAKARVRFTQAFGGLAADVRQTHGDSYSDACRYMYNEIEKWLPKAHLMEMHKMFEQSADIPGVELLHEGSGWGALEQKREPGIIPKGMVFPERLLGEEQLPFVRLLEEQSIPEWDGGMPASYMCDARWLKIMEDALAWTQTPSPQLLFHYGIASYENGNASAGIAALRKAVQGSREPVISRTLGAMYQKLGDMKNAIDCMREAMENGGLALSPGFALDYLDVLVEGEYYQDAWRFYESLPAGLKENELIQASAAKAAYETENWGFLEEQFAKEAVYTREGDMRIVELWFQYRARKIEADENIPFEEALEKAKRYELPPYEIDFLLFSEYEESE